MYRTPGMSESQRKTLLRKAQKKVSSDIIDVEAEICFNVSVESGLSAKEGEILGWYVMFTVLYSVLSLCFVGMLFLSVNFILGF